MQAQIVSLVFWAVCGGALIICIVLIVKANGHMRIRVMYSKNTDDEAAKMFCDLVREMTKSMIIHDDGTNTEDTLYNRDEVVECVRSRLQEEGVKIRCLFNENADLKLARLTEKFSRNQFEVYYLPSTKPPGWGNVHFKIIDGGMKAYLSRHLSGSEREYEIIDCADSLRTGKRLLSRFQKQFEQGVALAKPTSLE